MVPVAVREGIGIGDHHTEGYGCGESDHPGNQQTSPSMALYGFPRDTQASSTGKFPSSIDCRLGAWDYAREEVIYQSLQQSLCALFSL